MRSNLNGYADRLSTSVHPSGPHHVNNSCQGWTVNVPPPLPSSRPQIQPQALPAAG